MTTLELDVQITKDGHAVVTHDRRTTPVVCRDTAPAFPGDPAFSCLGKFVKDLTLAQVTTLDCGPRRHADPTTEDIDDFGGSLVPAVESFGADAISPLHGDPQGGSILDIGVDGIITDYPDRLRDLLETCGYQLPGRFGRS